MGGGADQRGPSVRAFDPDAFRDAAAAAVGLEIPESCKPGVAKNLERIHGFASLVLAFPELRSVERAARFDPREQRASKAEE